MKEEDGTGRTLRCIESPADTQIIVWIEKYGAPIVLAILDEIDEPSSFKQRDTYRGFVPRFGPRVAETAMRLYRDISPTVQNSNFSPIYVKWNSIFLEGEHVGLHSNLESGRSRSHAKFFQDILSMDSDRIEAAV
jgi:hypothetical protein